MRKLLCSLIISGLLLMFPVFVGAFVVAEEIPVDHSIFDSKTIWVFERSSEDFIAGGVVYNKFFLYYHPTHGEYSMQEGTVFGEVVTRVYYIMDESKGIYMRSFRLLGEDGIWRGGYKILWPELLTDASGKIVGARLVMVNEKKETLFIRDVMRK